MAREISVQMSDTDLFMDNFDPVNSNREKRKKLRTQSSCQSANGGSSAGGKRADKKSGILYNEKGILIHDQSDLCDCLSEKCLGCFFPCPKCRSPKCGAECRVHRRTLIESIEVEGTSIVIKNEHIPPNNK